MTTTRNHAIILVVTEGGLTITDTAARFGVSSRWVRVLLARYRAEGTTGLEPRSRRPRTSPHAITDRTRTQILRLRDQLTADGLNAGAESIRNRLPESPLRPAVSTIWRVLNRAGRVDPQPQKRPRSSWHPSEPRPRTRPGSRLHALAAGR